MELQIEKVYYAVVPTAGHLTLVPVRYLGALLEGLHQFHAQDGGIRVFNLRVDQVMEVIRDYDEVFNIIKHIADTPNSQLDRTIN